MERSLQRRVKLLGWIAMWTLPKGTTQLINEVLSVFLCRAIASSAHTYGAIPAQSLMALLFTYLLTYLVL